MSQDTEVKARYEHEQKERKKEREEQAGEDAINNEFLHPESFTHETSAIAPTIDSPTVLASDVKHAYELLPMLQHDELERVHLVRSGVHLKAGAVYIDLHDLARGELTARGDETVIDELLASKHESDYLVWNKILGR